MMLNYRSVLRGLVLVFAILLTTSSGGYAQGDEFVRGDIGLASQIAWHNFRTEHPLHTQAVALSELRDDGSRTLVVAEPTPSVKLADITKLSPCIASASPMQKSFGVDGWVRDVVLTLRPCREEQVQGLVIAIHRLMYGTAYKAYTLPIPNDALDEKPAVAHTAMDLNLHVTSAQLNRWLIGRTREKPGSGFGRILLTVVIVAIFVWIAMTLVSNRRFGWLVFATLIFLGVLISSFPHMATSSDHGVLRLRPVIGGSEVTLQTLLDSKTHGVYSTVEPGLVVWCVGKDRDLDHASARARMFAVDSDLVLGAIGSGDQLAIVGRTRSTSITWLPPLRTETIFQLASARTDELAQSYERKFMWAGKTNRTMHVEDEGDVDVDWAPIFLSDQLVDTEYGSLLNITDQMLKSWSSHGLVRYANFPYDDPSDYPFEQPLLKEVNTNEVTFNWNTRGAGYISHLPDFEVFSLSRLGSLPIDYLAKDNTKLRAAEDKAYAYYSGLSDPNLVRVVQYAGLYQIFTHFGVTANTAPSPHHPVTSLKELTGKFVKTFLSFPDSSPMFHHDEDADVKAIHEAHDLLKEFKASASADEYDQLITCMSDPAATQIDATSQDKDTRVIAGICRHVSGPLQNLLSGEQSVVTYAAEMYQLNANSRPATGWIHTPSVVFSTAIGSLKGSTGGHNLSATVTSFETDTSLAAGEVRVTTENGKATIYHSPEDAEKVPDIARAAGRDVEKTPEELKTELQNVLRQEEADTRTIAQALHPHGSLPNTETIGFDAEQVPPGGGTPGFWNAADASSADKNRLLAAFEGRSKQGMRPALIVSRDATHRYDIVGPNGVHLQADNAPAAVEAVRTIADEASTAKGVHIHFHGIDQDEGQGFVRSTEEHMTSEGPVDATFDGSMTPDELRIITADFDLSKGVVREVSQPFQVGDRIARDVAIEVKSKIPFGQRIVIHIRLFFENMAAATSDFTAQLTVVLQNIHDQTDFFFALSKFKSDLRLANPSIKDVEIGVIQREKKDLYVAWVERQNVADGEEREAA